MLTGNKLTTPERTLFRWLQEDAVFQQAYREARCAAVQQAILISIRLSYIVRFILIKPLVARASAGPESYAAHSRLPSPDRGRPPSGGGWCRGRYDSV